MRGILLSLITMVAACGSSVEEETGQPTDSGTSTDTAIADTSTPAGDGGRSTGSIKCGMETCNAATQDCCVGLSGAKCVAIGGCGGGSAFLCSDSVSCPSGQVCCAERLGGGAQCQMGCMGVVLCATDAECSADQRCVTGLGGVRVCRRMMSGGTDGGSPG